MGCAYYSSILIFLKDISLRKAGINHKPTGRELLQ